MNIFLILFSFAVASINGETFKSLPQINNIISVIKDILKSKSSVSTKIGAMLNTLTATGKQKLCHFL